MTEQMTRTIIHWSKVVGAVAIITSVSSTVLAAIVAIAFQVWGSYLLGAAGVATSAEMASVKEKVDDLLRRVVVLARPDQIAHYRDLPEPLNGYCVPGQECSFLIYAERDIRALECRILPRQTRLIVTQDTRSYTVPIMPRGQAVNLDATPSSLEPTFMMPRSLNGGEVTGVIESHYENCLWQTDGEPPATQESPRFRIEIRRE